MIFSLIKILTNLRKCYLKSNNLNNKLILVNKNWFNDFRVGCNSFTSLIKLIEFDATLKEDLEKYEGEFESDEILN